ncbi:MAG: cell division protein ZapA [candidate division KSB1 bacterium]|nr:cell division protein ZapA [candidate division KSB1 bacterium]MDQ7062711.1 cell division protein ZapA [candidate division KSB1 bacterium]
MNQQGNIIKVTIYGTEYPIRGETDAEYIKKVAAYVDQKMYEVERSSSAKSTVKVAILAALNIADELFREREEKQKLVKQFEEKIFKLSNLLNVQNQGEAETTLTE